MKWLLVLAVILSVASCTGEPEKRETPEDAPKTEEHVQDNTQSDEKQKASQPPPEHEPETPQEPAAKEIDPEARKAVSELEEYYARESGTREWEFLDHMGKRMWMRSAEKVARKYPEAMRQAILNGSPISEELIFTLGRVGGRKNVEFLVELAKKKPTYAVLVSLGYAKKKEEWLAVRKLLNHEDRKVASAAITGLARGGDRAVISVLKKWLLSGDEAKCNSAIHDCISLSDPELVDTLLVADSQIKGDNRKRLYRALAHCGSDKYLDKLHEMARDESEYEEHVKLGRHPDPAHRFINWNYTQNKPLDAIAALKSPRSLPVLDKLAKEAKDPKIREKAARIAADIRAMNQKK